MLPNVLKLDVENDVVLTLPNAAHNNMEIKNVDLMLLDVVNSKVD